MTNVLRDLGRDDLADVCEENRQIVDERLQKLMSLPIAQCRQQWSESDPFSGLDAINVGGAFKVRLSPTAHPSEDELQVVQDTIAILNQRGFVVVKEDDHSIEIKHLGWILSGEEGICVIVTRHPDFRHDNEKHNIELGTVVQIEIDWADSDDVFIKGTAQLYVVSHNRDCDGTPLYGLATSPIAPSQGKVFGDESRLHNTFVKFYVSGYPESSLTVVTKEELVVGTGVTVDKPKVAERFYGSIQEFIDEICS